MITIQELADIAIKGSHYDLISNVYDLVSEGKIDKDMFLSIVEIHMPEKDIKDAYTRRGF